MAGILIGGERRKEGNYIESKLNITYVRYVEQNTMIKSKHSISEKRTL